MTDQVKPKKSAPKPNAATVDAVEKKERKPAPSMSIGTVSVDERTELIEKLQKEDPECKYVFQESSITNEQLAAKGLQRTEHKLRNDIVCRTVKTSYEGWIAAKNKFNTEQMESIDTEGQMVQSFEASSKKPKS